jgi:lipid-A-disaccharide synthase-like uncharacterized protein
MFGYMKLPGCIKQVVFGMRYAIQSYEQRQIEYKVLHTIIPITSQNTGPGMFSYFLIQLKCAHNVGSQPTFALSDVRNN